VAAWQMDRSASVLRHAEST